MAERNVDLIIKARDEASKAFKSVNDSLQNLETVQQAVSTSAGLMGKALDGTEDDVKRLQASFNKGSFVNFAQGFDLVAKTVGKAKAKLEEQKAALASTEGRYKDLGEQLRAAKAALEKFQAQENKTADDTARIKATQKAVRSLSSSYKQAGTVLAKQQQQVAETESAYNRLTAAAAAQGAAIRSLEKDLQAQIDAAAISKRAAEQQAAAIRASRPSTAEQQALAASFRASNREGRLLTASLGQVAREIWNLGPAANASAQALNRAAGSTGNLRQAFRAFYGDSRRALGLMQRIRGEVLSLTASFVGFYGVFRTGAGFLEAFNELEASTNRLGAAFNQDFERVGQEIKRLSGEASRLGISFDVLSKNYSNFLISGQQAGIETEKLETIFRQVTEAGRVLKLSNDQITGTLTALTQIAGKGTVQMEELRQQLGDRLPGAVGLMAKSLGYAEDELDQFYKAVTDGNVSAREGLVALGQGLEDAYGGQLEEALDSTATKIGALQNLLFQRKLTAANSGFIEGLETAIDALNAFLESDEGIEFFESLGQAFGNLFEMLPGLIEDFDKLVLVFKAIVAIKITQTFQSLLAWIGPHFQRVVLASRQAVLAYNESLYRISPAMFAAQAGTTRFGAALRGLRTVMVSVATVGRALWVAIGGPVGLVVAALSYFAVDIIGDTLTGVDALDSAMTKAEDSIGRVAEAYREAAGDADVFNRKLQEISKTDIELDLRSVEKELETLKKRTFKESLFGDEIDKISKNLTGAVSPQAFQQFATLRYQFKQGAISAKEFKEGLDRVAQANQDMLDAEGLSEFRDYLGQMAEAEDKIARLEAELAVMNGTATEAQEVLAGVAEVTEDLAGKIDPAEKRMNSFVEAMRKLGEHIPGLEAELERFDAIKEIEADFKAAMEAANEFTDATERAARAGEAMRLRNEALNSLYAKDVEGYTGGSGAEVAASFLRDKEGFRSTPYWDVNAYRVGYGSDTITLADGTVQKVVQGMRVSVEDANRDLLRRITEEFLPKVRSQVGAERFDSFTAQQQGALTSIGYNYGELPDRILNAVRTGSDEQIAKAIRALSTDNGGVNARRRGEEAALFLSTEGHTDQIEAAEERLELEKEFHDQVRQRIEDEKFELSIQDKALQDREVAKALREAELEAKKAGVQLTKEERAELEKVTREKYAQQAAEEAREAKLKEAAALEEQITMLQERRRFLQEQQTHLEGQGDMVGAARIEEELTGVETQLESMIQKALEFWQALGGEGSEAAIQKLQITQSELARTESKVVTTGEQMNNMFADRFASAFDSFAQAIANGENAWDAFRTAFLQAAAEILIEIGQMIIRQALLNALTRGQGAGGGIGGMVAGGINALVAHGGGVAGYAGVSRSIDPALVANAVRYHGGGIAGLAPDEVSAVLQKGEEVVTENDPRHRSNGGLTPPMPTIINAVDGSDALEQALSTPRGQEALVNYMRSNRDQLKAALG